MKLLKAKKALRDLRKIPANERQRIRNRIDEVADNPSLRSRHVKMLKGRAGYRLMVGNWRVIFDVEGTVLAILEIGARGSIYD